MMIVFDHGAGFWIVWIYTGERSSRNIHFMNEVDDELRDKVSPHKEEVVRLQRQQKNQAGKNASSPETDGFERCFP